MMYRLRARMILHRVPELDISLETTGEVSVRFEGGAYRLRASALGILDVFSHAKPLARGLCELGPRLVGNATCDEHLATVEQLLEIGVLREGARGPAKSRRPYPFGLYDSPGVQIRMLADRPRREKYLEAVRRVVRRGDVVLDLGTGNGIMAVAAIRAGASRVYAVEAAAILGYAQHVFRLNHVAERVTAIEGWSENVRLSERADVLMCDLVGSDPLEGRLLEVTRDAIARHLLPGARVIPCKVRLWLVLVEVPRRVIETYVPRQGHVSRWLKWYGIDFSPLLDTPGDASVAAYVPPREARGFVRLSRPAAVWELDLKDTDGFRGGRVELEVERKGRCSGVFAVSEVVLAKSIAFVTDPSVAGAAPQWFTPVWLTPSAFGVKPGDHVWAEYRYEGQGISRVAFGLE